MILIISMAEKLSTSFWMFLWILSRLFSEIRTRALCINILTSLSLTLDDFEQTFMITYCCYAQQSQQIMRSFLFVCYV